MIERFYINLLINICERKIQFKRVQKNVLIKKSFNQENQGSRQ